MCTKIYKALAVVVILGGLAGCSNSQDKKSDRPVMWYLHPTTGTSRAAQQKALKQFMHQPPVNTKGFKSYSLIH